MAVQKFTATLNQEGSGSIRGKIPATMVKAMGGGHGDVIEFEIDRKVLVGGHIIRGQQAAKLRQTRQVQAPAVKAPVAKKPAPRVVVKQAPAKANGKAPLKISPPAAKPNNRTTAVKMKATKVQPPKAKVKPRFSL